MELSEPIIRTWRSRVGDVDGINDDGNRGFLCVRM